MLFSFSFSVCLWLIYLFFGGGGVVSFVVVVFVVFIKTLVSFGLHLKGTSCKDVHLSKNVDYVQLILSAGFR